MKYWLLTMIAFVSLPLSAQEYAVVVSARSNIESIDARLVRDIFLRKKNFAHGVRVRPVNVTGDRVVRRAFESTVLKLNREELNQYWVERHFQGVSPPGTQASFASVKKIVERVEGAISYLPHELIDEQVKVIYEF
jgi:hypothetical protein